MTIPSNKTGELDSVGVTSTGELTTNELDVVSGGDDKQRQLQDMNNNLATTGSKLAEKTTALIRS